MPPKRRTFVHPNVGGKAMTDINETNDQMKSYPFYKYLLNCFLLTLPILVWNIFLTNKLPKAFQPDIFWNKIPVFLTYGENISRAIVFALTLFMPLSIATPLQKKGLLLYLGGTLLYILSWLTLIYFSESQWSNTLLGFMAPAYTPFFWLIGIGLIGDSFYFNLPYRRWLFILTSIIFLVFHNLHTYTVVIIWKNFVRARF